MGAPKNMPRKRFKEEQIVAILKEGAAGMRTPEICRKHGITANTFYNWRARYAGMTVSDIKRMKSLEDENVRLKKKLAETILDLDTAKELLAKNF